jgi:hypothetical protein
VQKAIPLNDVTKINVLKFTRAPLSMISIYTVSPRALAVESKASDESPRSIITQVAGSGMALVPGTGGSVIKVPSARIGPSRGRSLSRKEKSRL